MIIAYFIPSAIWLFVLQCYKDGRRQRYEDDRLENLQPQLHRLYCFD